MVTPKEHRGLGLWWRPVVSITKSPVRPYARVNAPTTGRLDRSQLPDPVSYYAQELVGLKRRGRWASARCCFHDDHRPSLSVNLETGAYRCFACGACGRDLIAFRMARYQQDFRSACIVLGAWKESS